MVLAHALQHQHHTVPILRFYMISQIRPASLQEKIQDHVIKEIRFRLFDNPVEKSIGLTSIHAFVAIWAGFYHKSQQIDIVFTVKYSTVGLINFFFIQ